MRQKQKDGQKKILKQTKATHIGILKLADFSSANRGRKTMLMLKKLKKNNWSLVLYPLIMAP